MRFGGSLSTDTHFIVSLVVRKDRDNLQYSCLISHLRLIGVRISLTVEQLFVWEKKAKGPEVVWNTSLAYNKMSLLPRFSQIVYKTSLF